MTEGPFSAWAVIVIIMILYLRVWLHLRREAVPQKNSGLINSTGADGLH